MHVVHVIAAPTHSSHGDVQSVHVLAPRGYVPDGQLETHVLVAAA